ncbi:MAG: hypothetical protein KDD47_16235, partial [Acidobacteria bacterium]|nr:hypothetical protein [Acidobacteriota bacterium]
MKALLHSVRSAALEGFVFGGLLYGAVLAWLHVLHNHLTHLADGLITFLCFVLLYGLWAAALFGGVAFLASVFRGLLGHSGHGDEPPAVFFPGVLLFNLLFWELFFLYGLTYDQAPAFARGGPKAMASFLGAAALVVAAGVFFVSWAVVWTWRRLGAAGWRRKAAVGLFAAGFLL